MIILTIIAVIVLFIGLALVLICASSEHIPGQSPQNHFDK